QQHAGRVDRSGKLDLASGGGFPAQRAIIVLVAHQEHEFALAPRQGQLADLAGQQLARAALTEIGMCRERSEQITLPTANADGRHPYRPAGRTVDLGNEAQRGIDRKTLPHPEGRARKPARTKSDRLKLLNEDIVVRRSKTY